MQIPDSPQIRQRIAIAREYGDRIKDISASYNKELDRIWRRYLQLLKRAVISGGNTSAILDALINTLWELLQSVIDNSIDIALKREEQQSDTQHLIISASVPQCNMSYYEDTLHKYEDILQEEIAFAVEGGYTSDIDLFMLNPMAYMSNKDNGLQGLKTDITSVSKGVSYSFEENMKKLGISVAALAYASSMMSLWHNSGIVAGYFGVRNSNFPCPLCDSYAYMFIPMSQGMVYPLHNRCVCSIVPLYQNEIP